MTPSDHTPYHSTTHTSPELINLITLSMSKPTTRELVEDQTKLIQVLLPIESESCSNLESNQSFLNGLLDQQLLIARIQMVDHPLSIKDKVPISSLTWALTKYVSLLGNHLQSALASTENHHTFQNHHSWNPEHNPVIQLAVHGCLDWSREGMKQLVIP